jgi:DNA-binding MarR family transcriptional regulator
LKNTDDNVEVAAALRRTVGALYRRLLQNERGGLTPAQLSLLATIEAHGPLRPGELAAREQVTPATVTRSVSWAVDRDLARRIADPHDRRSSLVEISPAGAALLATLRESRTAEFERRLKRLSPEERATLASGLKALETFYDARSE